MITLETYQLRQLLTDAAELGAQRALEKAGNLSPQVTKAEAYRLYGRAQVDRWISERVVKQIHTGHRVRLLRAEIEAVAKANQRIY